MYSRKYLSLGEISSGFSKRQKNSAQKINSICRDNVERHSDVWQGKHTTQQSEHTPLSLYRRFLGPGAFGLAPLPVNCRPFAYGARPLGISMIALPVAPCPFFVCWDGVKWASNVPRPLLGGGFDPGLGLCCEGLAAAMDFLALAGVPSPCLPVDFGGGGGGSGTHRPLPLVGWAPLLALHTSFPYNLLETHLQGLHTLGPTGLVPQCRSSPQQPSKSATNDSGIDFSSDKYATTMFTGNML